MAVTLHRAFGILRGGPSAELTDRTTLSPLEETVRAMKNLSQLAGIGCIVWALYTAWHTLPLKEAFVTGLATLTTTAGPTGQEQIVILARELPERLASSPWLLLGAALILVPYIAEMVTRAVVPQTHPHRY